MSTYPNYIRTLLLNQGPADFDNLAEEYVSPFFVPRDLPPSFLKIRSVLYGGNPDREMLNFRLYQLMQLLHATQLVEYVLQDDNRITYTPFDQEELFFTAFGARSTAALGTTTEMNIIGDITPNEASGILRHEWRVLVNDAGTITVTEYKPTSAQSLYEYTLTDGLSNLIPLSGSSLLFNFNGGAGDQWFVEATAKPVRNMAEILATLCQVVSPADMLVLFGESPVEPYLTFRNLWKKNEQYAYKLGGLLLAMAFRTADLAPPIVVTPSVPIVPPPVPPIPPIPPGSLSSLPSVSSETPTPPTPGSSSLSSATPVPPTPSSSLSSSSAVPDLPPVTAGLEAWFDGQDASTLTVVGSNISQWDDKSGNAHHLPQATGADQPTVGTLNSYAAVAFTGGQHIGGITWSLQSPTTIFLVYKFDSPIDNGLNVLFWSDSTDRIRYDKRTAGTGGGRRMHENSDLIGSAEDASAHYFTGIYDGGSSALRIDGADDNTGGVGTKTPSSDGLTIGSTKNGLSGYEGAIGELLWYDALLTGGEIAQVEAWLKDKWGL